MGNLKPSVLRVHSRIATSVTQTSAKVNFKSSRESIQSSINLERWRALANYMFSPSESYTLTLLVTVAERDVESNPLVRSVEQQSITSLNVDCTVNSCDLENCQMSFLRDDNPP